MSKREVKSEALRNTKIPTWQASPPWTKLPLELTENILQRLDAVDKLKNAVNVCCTWRKVCQNPSMWRVINIKRDYQLSEERCTIMCRRAVDRSQGQLIDLTMANFGDGDLLDYIATRSSNLRRLAFSSCIGIFGTDLRKAVKKLPKLEELHLFNPKQYIHYSFLESIGFACPNLNSFSFSLSPSDRVVVVSLQLVNSNDVAGAIAKSMPNLIRVRLVGNYLDDNALEAILDGCPRLESLDLHECFNLDLSEPLRERCQQQIKHLRLPA